MVDELDAGAAGPRPALPPRHPLLLVDHRFEDPQSGRRSLVSVLEECGARARLVDTHEDGTVPQLPLGDCDAILVAGGDSLVARALPLALAGNLPVGVVPWGPHNLLAEALGLPADWRAAARVPFDGAGYARVDALQVDTEVAGDEARLHAVRAVTFGYDAATLEAMRPSLRRRIGSVAYLYAGLLHARSHRPHRLDLRVDGARLSRRASRVVVALLPGPECQGIPEAGLARRGDGVSVAVFAPRTLAERLRVGLEVALGRRSADVAVELRQAHDLLLRFHRVVPVALDGEPLQAAWARITVLPGCLRVFAPRPGGASPARPSA
ncbi:MAG: diacylglycerol/lipid kinase family protein [Candidatus Dormibacteria bacterium]